MHHELGYFSQKQLVSKSESYTNQGLVKGGELSLTLLASFKLKPNFTNPIPFSGE